jgi:hypothetical protein
VSSVTDAALIPQPREPLPDGDADYEAWLAQEQDKAYAEYCREYAGDRCASFQPGGYQDEEGRPHWDHHCGAPDCPYPPQRSDWAFNVRDHSLGHRDELLSHIQRCADAGWTEAELTAEADRVQVALRPGDPWTFSNSDLGGMVQGALRKAPRHQAENAARADEEEQRWRFFFTEEQLAEIERRNAVPPFGRRQFGPPPGTGAFGRNTTGFGKKGRR